MPATRDKVKNVKWWADRYDCISGVGYELPPRYKRLKSGRNGELPPGVWSDLDGLTTIQATRKDDGEQVILKKLKPEEADIAGIFSPPKEDLHYFIPILDMKPISLKNKANDKAGWEYLLVMPNLPNLRRLEKGHHFGTPDEFKAFFTLICKGLKTMHKQNIAHRGACTKIFRTPYKNCTANNIMVDHPHFYLDFTLSQRLQPQNGAQWDHYYWDIYCFGNLVRKKFKRNCSAGLHKLVDEMTDKPLLIEGILEKIKTDTSARP